MSWPGVRVLQEAWSCCQNQCAWSLLTSRGESYLPVLAVVRSTPSLSRFVERTWQYLGSGNGITSRPRPHNSQNIPVKWLQVYIFLNINHEPCAGYALYLAVLERNLHWYLQLISATASSSHHNIITLSVLGQPLKSGHSSNLQPLKHNIKFNIAEIIPQNILIQYLFVTGNTAARDRVTCNIECNKLITWNGLATNY